MATYTFVELKIPEAGYLADLYGIERDLNDARELADKLKGMIYTASADGLLIDPL